MSNKVQIVQNICGGISKSNISKVGLSESVNTYPEIQQNTDEKSVNMIIRSVEGQVLAANIPGKCRGMYRVSRGYDNKPTLYAVYDTTLYLIDSNNNFTEIGRIDSYNTECHMTESSGYRFCSSTFDYCGWFFCICS